MATNESTRTSDTIAACQQAEHRVAEAFALVCTALGCLRQIQAGGGLSDSDAAEVQVTVRIAREKVIDADRLICDDCTDETVFEARTNLWDASDLLKLCEIALAFDHDASGGLTASPIATGLEKAKARLEGAIECLGTAGLAEPVEGKGRRLRVVRTENTAATD